MTLDRDAVEKIRAATTPEFSDGHCRNHAQPGGCQLHNLQCGWPKCDQQSIREPLPKPADEQVRALCDLALEALSAREATEGGKAVADPCMWDVLKPCTCGGGYCEQVSFGAGAVEAEVIGEHSGCGHGVQVDSLTVRLAPGDKVYVVRDKIGRSLLPASRRTERFYTALRSASIPPSGVAVKPLEWVQVIPGRLASDIYVVERVYLDEYCWKIWKDKPVGFPKVVAGHLTLDEAKAAAQADYEARIRSALIPSPSGVAEARALEAAAKVAEGSKPIVHGNYYRGQREQADKIAAAIRNLIPTLSKEAE